MKTEDLTTLHGLEAAAWRRLEDSAAHRRGPAHLLTLATQGAEGPEQRLLVLRGADRWDASLEFWTNRASTKVKELENAPRAAALFWDETAGLQVRLWVHIVVRQGDPAIWKDLPEIARRNYLAGLPPSSALSRPEQIETAEASLDQFCVLAAKVTAMECLCLSTTPHRRARFTNGRGYWIAP